MHDIYRPTRQAFGTGQVNWLTCNPYLQLYNANYVASIDDVYLSAVPAAGRVGAAIKMTGIGMDDGIARAASVELGISYAGAYVVGGIIYANSGSEATSRLIACYANVLGLPGIIPAGGSIWTWDSSLGLFRL
jgi:hypothetical protein